MAYIANTAFEARITNNMYDELCNITGKYMASGAGADCSAGLLCVKGAQLDCEGFTGVKNENAWEMAAAAATDVAPIYACNTYDVQLLANGDNEYKIGHKTLGLGVPANEYGTFTIVNFDGRSHYRFGVGNFSAAVGSNGFATIANGLLVPAAAAPESGVYFKIIGSGNFVEGSSESFGYVDVIACRA